MARILVEADDQHTVLLDERHVKPEHVLDAHAARQLVERLEWALSDEDGGRERPIATSSAERVATAA